MPVKAAVKKSSKTSPDKKVVIVVADDEALLRELEITRKTFLDVSCELSKSLENCVYVMGH